MIEPERRVQSVRYTDPDSGQVDILWEVMQKTPTTWPNGAPWKGTGCWGNYYRIGCYSDKAAADEHARTGRKPHGYGR